MDVRYLDPFLSSLCNTFETRCGLPVRLRKPELKTGHAPATDVSAIVGFSGDAAGSVVLSFSFDVASRIATGFAGNRIVPRDHDFADAIGELAIMVADGAKALLHGLDLSLSLPNVIVGAHHNVPAFMASTRIVIPCDTEAGEFFVEVGMVLAQEPSVAGTHGALQDPGW